MSYCLKPDCRKPQNPAGAKFCLSCGSKLLLKERYRAIKLIGQGGFGKTFLAVDEDKPSKPRCVIKQFFPQAQGTNNAQKAAKLFEQEAVRLDELGKHPQIPELLAHFGQDNHQYLVQEFIDGQNLAQALEAEGAFSETQIRDLLKSLLPVVEFIHSHKIIHRDIKPENIIRRVSPYQGEERGSELVLVDFGAAKFATGTALLQTGTTIGTPEYIAPEQARGKAVFASDLYGLGVTCIYLLTQVSPFDLFDTNEDTWVWRHFLFNNPVSDELGRILDKLIANATSRRYQSATEVLKALNPVEMRNFVFVQGTATPALRQAMPAVRRKLVAPAVITSAFEPPTQNWCCVHTLRGHTKFVYSVAFSPYGLLLASGSLEGTIKIWRVKDGKEIRTLTGHTMGVSSVAFSPDGLLLASGSHDKTIKIWQLSTGKKLRTIGGWFSGHSLQVNAIAFSPNGLLIASCSHDKTIKIWRVQDGQPIRTLMGHSNSVNCVAFSPDGLLLASCSHDKTIKIWRVQDGRQIRTITGHSNSVNCVAFSPDGLLLASVSEGPIKIWRVKDGQEIRTLKSDKYSYFSVAFSSDGLLLANGSGDSTIKIWRVKDGQKIRVLKGHTAPVRSVAFSPDGQTLATGSGDRTIKLWRCDG